MLPLSPNLQASETPCPTLPLSSTDTSPPPLQTKKDTLSLILQGGSSEVPSRYPITSSHFNSTTNQGRRERASRALGGSLAPAASHSAPSPPAGPPPQIQISKRDFYPTPRRSNQTTQKRGSTRTSKKDENGKNGQTGFSIKHQCVGRVSVQSTVFYLFLASPVERAWALTLFFPIPFL